ncbi:hypothetical protein M011DRAFT_156353 [Sporormia fimetaria CBS 119925]|uniref:Uncharacterized protein n=1 Tax=Sporormia fimetaria CBS 119925 TaxID=1340428 RepID=A0A6A6V6B1_9PLEO|nr:hypothetical protein M011DRAFT_156353 [Sporormia fimetaria CBS 119925]
MAFTGRFGAGCPLFNEVVASWLSLLDLELVVFRSTRSLPHGFHRGFGSGCHSLRGPYPVTWAQSFGGFGVGCLVLRLHGALVSFLGRVSGFRVLDSGFWILDSGFWILDSGFWILDSGYWIYWIICRRGFCLVFFSSDCEVFFFFFSVIAIPHGRQGGSSV